MIRGKIEPGMVDEFLADLRAELEIEPSSSFAARVRQQVEGLEHETRGSRWWLRAIGPAAAAAMVLAIAVLPDSPADRPSPPASPGHVVQDPTPQAHVVQDPTSQASVAPPPAALPSAVVPAPRLGGRAPTAVAGPVVDDVPVVEDTLLSDRILAFDPFTDVVVSPGYRRGLAALVATLDTAAANGDEGTTTEILRAFEPQASAVRVMALNEPSLIVVAPIKVIPLADLPAEMPR